MFSDKLREVYLDYVNNYYKVTKVSASATSLNIHSISVFAEHNGLTYDQAICVINLGRDCHRSHLKMME